MKDKELKRIFNIIKEDRNKGIEFFYKECNRFVYKIAFCILKNEEDAEDVIQNILKKLYVLDYNKFPQNHEMTWLYSIVKNEAISTLRTKKYTIDLEEIYEISDENDELSKIIEKDKYNRMIKGLSDKEKQIVSMKILSGFSFKEIGKMIGEPEGTIKWRYYKSLYTLKLLLGNMSMFVINFIVGVKLLQQNQEKNKNGTIVDNQTVNDSTTITETQKNEFQDSIDNKKNENIYIETEDAVSSESNTIQEEPQIATENNNIANGFITISIIFLIFTIILLFSYIKHQLKIRTKSSNK